MSVTTYNNGIPVLSIPVNISSTPSAYAYLPWNGYSKPYQWITTLAVTTQYQSGTNTRQQFQYNGQDINVGSWITNLSTGLAWQIVSITSKTSTSVVCIVQDILRYNTYRNSSRNGNGSPVAGSYVVFNLSDDGTPMIDPAPSGVGTNFFTTLTTRFAYIAQEQYDFPLSQPSNAAVTGFTYGDIVAIDEPTQTFVLADASHTTTTVGRVTAIDDSQTVFTVNPLNKIVDNLNSLPGQVGSLIYTDTTNPGGLTTNSGGALVYLQIRSNTQTVVLSNTFASTTTPYTTVGYTFNVNGVLASISGNGYLIDVVNAINQTTSSSGVTAVLSGSGPYYITSTAVDARAINFADVSGTVTTDIGLASGENGIKAAGMVISSGSSSNAPSGLTNAYGFVYVQSSAATQWIITHNGGTTNVTAQVYDNFNGLAASGNVILPDEITIIDINNIQINFQSVQSGTALLTIFK